MDMELGACRAYVGSAGTNAPAIYVVDAPELSHGVGKLARDRRSSVVSVPVLDWGRTLTPWPSVGLRPQDPDFGGEGPRTLEDLTQRVIPAIERAEGLSPRSRAICGYSLGGLFALHAFVRSGGAFAACACVSGSVWYEGWVDYLRGCQFEATGRYPFLSWGTKERRWGPPPVRGVQDCMEECERILAGRGCAVELRMGPGNHLQHQAERLDAALTELDAFLLSAARSTQGIEEKTR